MLMLFERTIMIEIDAQFFGVSIVSILQSSFSVLFLIEKTAKLTVCFPLSSD